MDKKVFAQNSYQVLGTKELNLIIGKRQSEISSSYIIEYNGAFVTIFNDSTSIILPPVLGGNEGIFFKNLDAMKTMVDAKTFPVKHMNTFWENEKDRILELPSSISYYCLKLSEIINSDVFVFIDKNYLRTLSDMLNKKMENFISDSLKMNYLKLYIVELLRVQKGGTWKYAPQAALNVYFIPEIVVENKFCSPWNFLDSEIRSTREIDLNLLISKLEEMFYIVGNRRYL